MYSHILVPVDGGPLSRKATAAAIKLAKQLQARITCVHATSGFVPMMYDGITPPPELISRTAYRKSMEQSAAKVLGAMGDMCRKAGVACEGVHVPETEPYRAIIDTAKRRRCDLILMASHGRRGIASLLLGSETQKVLTHSKIPVIVHR